MYWGIPPEVNAFRLTMAGAGPTAHVAQVAAFESAAITHTQQAAQMAATAAATAPSFVGAGGESMVQCAAMQSTWMATASAFAHKSAGTIGAGIDAYASAVAATIPVPAVVANRLREAALQATNIIGQNTPAIAESNIEYGEFWAQNAGAMMGYLTAVTGLIGSLAAPLPALPEAANPAMAAAAGAAATGMSLGLQGAGMALSGATQAGATALSAGTGAVTSGVGALSAATDQGAQGSQAGQSGVASGAPVGVGAPALPIAEQADPSQALQSAEGTLGSMMSAPSMATSTVGQLISQAGQLPSQMGGQLSGLLSPALSAAGGGFGGVGTPGLGGPGLDAAGGPWSGIGRGTGGFAGGGSPVSAALTKPSAGAGMTGSLGVPSAWWNNAGGENKTAAGVRGASGPIGAGPMGPGMYGMPAGARAGSRRKNRDLGDADKSVFVDHGVGGAVPVYTDDGVVYVQGQGV